ncbi:MAG: hypothetical protein JWN37_702 [Candidatus Nomurabacteria bacterium]|nr:hypothetical protein [Candidatus Nomurabacteria bacterium]
MNDDTTTPTNPVAGEGEEVTVTPAGVPEIPAEAPVAPAEETPAPAEAQ